MHLYAADHVLLLSDTSTIDHECGRVELQAHVMSTAKSSEEIDWQSPLKRHIK